MYNPHEIPTKYPRDTREIPRFRIRETDTILQGSLKPENVERTRLVHDWRFRPQGRSRSYRYVVDISLISRGESFTRATSWSRDEVRDGYGYRTEQCLLENKGYYENIKNMNGKPGRTGAESTKWDFSVSALGGRGGKGSRASVRLVPGPHMIDMLCR
jgi:hypothetical protein